MHLTVVNQDGIEVESCYMTDSELILLLTVVNKTDTLFVVFLQSAQWFIWMDIMDPLFSIHNIV